MCKVLVARGSVDAARAHQATKTTTRPTTYWKDMLHTTIRTSTIVPTMPAEDQEWKSWKEKTLE
eukprot:4798364-Amphidinium_carterae.1